MMVGEPVLSDTAIAAARDVLDEAPLALRRQIADMVGYDPAKPLQVLTMAEADAQHCAEANNQAALLLIRASTLQFNGVERPVTPLFSAA